MQTFPKSHIVIFVLLLAASGIINGQAPAGSKGWRMGSPAVAAIKTAGRNLERRCDCEPRVVQRPLSRTERHRTIPGYASRDASRFKEIRATIMSSLTIAKPALTENPNKRALL